MKTLNHPHVCTLYDVGPNYLVMEFIEGSTLADELKKGPFVPEVGRSLWQRKSPGRWAWRTR